MSQVDDATAGPAIDGLTFVSLLGKGGYSYVYLYERISPRMRVAVKVLRDGRLSAGERAQFAAEAETMAELADHPFIVQVFSTGVLDDGRPYLVMKYYPRPNLAVRAASERFTVPDALRIGVQIASAVETAHRAGILHRDIKPANVLVSQYGETGLTDFGIAGHAADTDDGEDLGVSIPWSPPEVLSGASNGSVQSDVYSLAATVWHLLAGRAPFEVPGGDNSPGQLMSRTMRLPVPPTGRAEVPQSLERLLAQAMSKNPAVRPRSALELARALQAIEQEQRFGRTDIVVDGLTAPETRPASAQSQSADPTSLRPQRVSGATPPPTLAPPPTVAPPPSPPITAPPITARPAAVPRASAPPVEPPTVARPTTVSPAGRQRVTPQAPVENATVQRPSAPAASPPEAPERRRGLRRGWVLAAAAVIAIAAVVLGVVLSSGGSKDGPTASGTTSRTPSPQDVVVGASPPVVHASYDAHAKAVSFTWAAAAKGDTFGWYPAGEPGQLKRTGRLGVTVPAASPARVCIQVVEIRTDGSFSDPSAKVCGA